MIKFLTILVFSCYAFADKPEWVPYVSPMMLGRTFDKSKNQVGVDIINLEDVTNTEIVNGTKEFMKFKAGESDESKRDLLDVGGSLALKIKGGFIQVKGSGQYIKEENKGEKYYELLTLVQRKTRVISLASEVEANTANIGDIIGKHYVSKIQYGANMVASLRFKYKDDKEKENIKAAIEGSISDTTGSGSFNIQASANLSKIDEQLNSQYSLEIKYYADVQLDDVPQNIEDFKALVNRFSSLVAETTDNGMGRPISAYVQPLTALLGNAPEYNADLKTHERIPDLEREISDLIVAKNLLYIALKDKRTLTEQQEGWISDFYETIIGATKAYREVISKLDLETGPEQFQKTNEAFLKIKELDSWKQRFTLCPEAEKKSDVPIVTFTLYSQLARRLICHMERERSNSIYDTQVRNILSLKTDFMDNLDKRNTFLNNVLTLSKDYTARAKTIFQHYFMATRDGQQSGIQKGGKVVFNNVQLKSSLKDGYDSSTGVFTAPTNGLYLLSQHVSGTNMDMDGDDQGICPITQAHTKSMFKKMREGETYEVTSDTDTLVGQSSFMGILVDVEKNEEKVCAKKHDLEDDNDEQLEDSDKDVEEKDDEENTVSGNDDDDSEDDKESSLSDNEDDKGEDDDDDENKKIGEDEEYEE
uniref:Toxin candidate TRINITY_DN29930_c0_g2_i1 n=1 Tax=Pachycerianthus maua TaxID=2736681 RepID=A0A7G7WZ54_9CNID|nr:toxin candidate TRINITY_DN29930_c0_g2_i1 [Pachycerianthus maua]